MDPRLKRYYESELYHLREMGAEFAKEFPKIARRLGMEGFECNDPYVERLLDGFAFLAARVQLKLDAQFPEFTQHLLELVYPQYLAPTPSMGVMRFEPDMGDTDLASGVTLARDTSVRSILGKGEQTPCEFRTSQPVTLLPIEISGADYFSSPGAIGTLGLRDVPNEANAAV
ncbi:MAG: type VI secretion system baseplate subunit TssF, partial [Pseudomonadota bacterium]